MPGGRAGSGTGWCQVVASGSSSAHRPSAASGLWPSSGGPVRTLNGAAVVDGVLEHRPGKHQPVGQGDADAHRGADGVQALAGDRAMQVRGLGRRTRIRSGSPSATADDHPEVGDHLCVKDRITHARSARPSARSLRCRVRSVTDSGGPAPAGSTAAGAARPWFAVSCRHSWLAPCRASAAGLGTAWSRLSPVCAGDSFNRHD